MTATAPARRRRAPDEARREIFDAAERLIRERPLAELSVKSVMARTSLTRNAFYAYFEDVYDLIARVVDRLRGEADDTMEAFAAAESDTAVTGREALRGAARLYRDHGELLRALATAAQRDPRAARAWREFTSQSEVAVTARVQDEIRRGRIEGIDAEPTVRALVAMNRACFFEQLVGRPDADLDALVDTLHRVWVRALYGV